MSKKQSKSLRKAVKVIKNAIQWMEEIELQLKTPTPTLWRNRGYLEVAIGLGEKPHHELRINLENLLIEETEDTQFNRHNYEWEGIARFFHQIAARCERLAALRCEKLAAITLENPSGDKS